MSRQWSVRNLQRIGILGLWLVVVLVLAGGCADNREPQPIELGKLSDAHKSSIGTINLDNISDVDLVEDIAKLRADYKRLLQLLRQWYLDNGYYQKSRWAARELDDLNHVKTYPYLMISEIQREDLKPSNSIPQADALYQQAVKLYHDGQVLPFMNDMRKLKEALALFKELIKTYPSSDKIDDAAFYAGRMSKEYFNDNEQAVHYYQLAIKWNPDTPHPARYECALVYDYRLHNRAKALEMYRRVLKENADFNRSNTSFARTRITQLLTQ